MSSVPPPFGLAPVQPVFDRVTRLAKALFSAFDASIVLIDGATIWRSRDHGDLATGEPCAQVVMRESRLLVEDGRTDDRFALTPAVTGSLAVRFYAGAPIRLKDGTTPGVLCVISREPRAFDAKLAQCLQDLADSVADECDRGRLANEVARHGHELSSTLARLERSEQRLKMALDMAQIHVYDVDYDREFIETAGAPNDMYGPGLSFEELAGEALAFVDPRDRERVGRAYEQHFEDGAPCKYEFRVNRPDGQEVWGSAVAQVTRDADGRMLRAVGAMQNITERKRDEVALRRAKEGAEAANLAKSTFLATMSHEIRTPLNGVLGMAQAMEVDELTPVQRGRLDVIRQSGETLLVILNDILDLSKIEAGKLELEDTEFDLGELMAGAHAAFTIHAEERGLGFRLQVEPAALGVYRGDPTRVRQIIYNLVSNAVKFTQVGEVEVRVAPAEAGLRVSVRDTGIGISPEAQERLFRKFEQADASTTRRFGGTGLGLAICRELVVLMGGEVSAVSELGQGSTFTVLLPLPWVRSAAVSREAISSEPAPNPSREGVPLRVLAAEDNLVNQLVLTTLFAQIGVEPVMAGNGAEAVAMWEREPWDLILMDAQMPVLDGLGATRRIRAREAESRRPYTPIIALTANAMSHHVADYEAAGMDGFVPKPIEVGKLFAAMEAALALGDQRLIARAQRRGSRPARRPSPYRSVTGRPRR